MKTSYWSVVYATLLTVSIFLHIFAKNAHQAYVSTCAAVNRATDPTAYAAAGGISPEHYFRQSSAAFFGITATAATLLVLAFRKRDWMAWTAFAISILIIVVTQQATGYRV